jgi:hypothetical protein
MAHMDNLLFAIIIAGVGLSVTYLRAELALRQELKAERETELALPEPHITRPRREHTALLRQPSTVSRPIQTNPFRPMRDLARALRILIQGRIIRLFWIRT